MSPIISKGNWSHVPKSNISHVIPLSLFVTVLKASIEGYVFCTKNFISL